MSLFSENTLHGLNSLNISKSTSLIIEKHIIKQESNISSIYIETRPTVSDKVDMTTCHHFSTEWAELDIDPNSLNEIQNLSHEFQPQSLWLEYDDVASKLNNPGLHLSVKKQSALNVKKLCEILFKGTQPINDDTLINILGNAQVQHISRLYRNNSPTLKIHIKPKFKSGRMDCYFLHEHVKLKGLFHILDVIKNASEDYKDYIYFDLSFNNKPNSIAGLYLSNKEAKNTEYLNDLEKIISLLPVKKIEISKLIKLVKSNINYSLDIKVVIEKNEIYLKPYLGLIKNINVEQIRITKKLMELFS
ncbi:hypothetical protein BGP78_15115 [Pseudoalteromonas sp. MSK9-3]|uniref:hypothetical protein n=1 Tax=Pseudoalteromonas sp. MSK9-3 TaxID=1897633 RepID=UPI000E6BC74F|nr:hypothetical protein [Pseudoalteromonas sp. MSK9-3]RJE76041.1 hypothetical protein BGP78_15115 [Pseudoalteromonas sp. MSK9-3]